MRKTRKNIALVLKNATEICDFSRFSNFKIARTFLFFKIERPIEARSNQHIKCHLLKLVHPLRLLPTSLTDMIWKNVKLVEVDFKASHPLHQQRLGDCAGCQQGLLVQVRLLIVEIQKSETFTRVSAQAKSATYDHAIRHCGARDRFKRDHIVE